MKKIYGFLGALAILSMVGCSKDADLGPETPVAKGDLYMTMAITPSSSTRTATPEQGSEVGKDRENAITSALLVFAKKNASVEGNYDVHAAVTTGDIAGTTSPYLATFKMERSILLDEVKGQSAGLEFGIFVIANPTSDIVTAYNEAAESHSDVQTTFSLLSDANTYWTDYNFLMTSADVHDLTIKEADVAVGTHITADDAFDLGSVKIQRAMSRFDLNLANVKDNKTLDFSASDNNSDLKNITVKFDAMALVNMAQTAYMFKTTAAAPLTGGLTLSFEDERVDAVKTHYVFSPDQNYKWTYPLFDNLGAAADATADKKFDGTSKNLASFFANSNSYTTIAAVAGEDGEDDNEFKYPNNGGTYNNGNYRIWRYCMENTNYDKNNQYHSNTTGIIFRAEITGDNISGDEPLYAFNNVIIGSAATLRDYATNNDPEDGNGIYNAVKIYYADAVAAYNKKQTTDSSKFTFEKKGEGEAPEGSELAKGYKSLFDPEADLSLLDKDLVANHFSIYRPDEGGKFYCYYIYYNRHNDNGKLTEMGPMEFATVRNNIYKLSVAHVNRLGHPGDPNDDPDPEDPNTPDEKDNFYCKIECIVLDWEVRLNDIEF